MLQSKKRFVIAAVAVLLAALCIFAVSYTVWYRKGTRPLEGISLSSVTCRTYSCTKITTCELAAEDIVFVEALLQKLVVHGRGKEGDFDILDGGGYPSFHWRDVQGNTGELLIVTKYNMATEESELRVVLTDGLTYVCDTGTLETLIGFCEAKCGDGAVSP